MKDQRATSFFSNCIGVFQGGGVRAAAFAGAYKAAAESGVAFSALAGTSAGSVAAALIATGAAPKAITKKLMALDFEKFIGGPDRKQAFSDAGFLASVARKSWKAEHRNIGTVATYGGLHSSKQILHWVDDALQELLREQGRTTGGNQVRFRDLPIPLFVVATDIISGTYAEFSSKLTPEFSVAAAVRASCSIPFFFQPVKNGNVAYVDGGLLSNLPSFVFDSSGDEDLGRYSARVLGFRLVSDSPQGVMPTSILELGKCIANTVVDGAADIQQRLQPNHHTVSICTGSIKATDFRTVKEKEKRQLFRSGYKAVAEFLKNEGSHFRGFRMPTTFVGRDQQMLLIVRSLAESNERFVLLDRQSRWLYLIFPAFLEAVRRGVQIDYLTTDEQVDPDEAYRRRLLLGLGAQICIRQELPYTGFLVDPGIDAAFAAITHRSSVPYMEEYEKEETRTYSRRADAEVMRYLVEAAKLPTRGSTQSASRLTLQPCAEDTLFRRLRGVPQYRNASFSLLDVPLDGNVQATQVHVKEFKFLQIDGLIREFARNSIHPFAPQEVRLINGMTTIITPPVLEQHGSFRILMEGHTRALHCIRAGRRTIRAVVVTGVDAALPAKPRSLLDLTIASRTLNFLGQYENYREDMWRPIEAHVHPVDDGLNLQQDETECPRAG